MRNCLGKEYIDLCSSGTKQSKYKTVVKTFSEIRSLFPIIESIKKDKVVMINKAAQQFLLKATKRIILRIGGKLKIKPQQLYKPYLNSNNGLYNFPLKVMRLNATHKSTSTIDKRKN